MSNFSVFSNNLFFLRSQKLMTFPISSFVCKVAAIFLTFYLISLPTLIWPSNSFICGELRPIFFSWEHLLDVSPCFSSRDSFTLFILYVFCRRNFFINWGLDLGFPCISIFISITSRMIIIIFLLPLLFIILLIPLFHYGSLFLADIWVPTKLWHTNTLLRMNAIPNKVSSSKKEATKDIAFQAIRAFFYCF